MDSSKSAKTAMTARAGPAGMHSYFLSYPVFCAGSDGQGLLLTGGGGGGKAYGVVNYLQAHVVILGTKNSSVTLETIATMDTGDDAPTALDYCREQGGVWACALGGNCMLFKFNDDTLSVEPLTRFRSETSGPSSHMTNFIRISQFPDATLMLATGGEDKVLRVWRANQVGGVGTKISNVSLIREIPDHQAEVVDGDFFMSSLLSCGKDGTVRVWNVAANFAPVATLQPRPIDKRFDAQPISLRSAFFVNQTDVVVLTHHPRGPAYLSVFNLHNPSTPVNWVCVSKAITPSMGIHPSRTRIVVSHAGGEKDIYSIPSLRLLHRSKKHCHEMPPGDTLFANGEDLTVSVSPDFSLNFFDPKIATSKCAWLFWLVVLLLALSAYVWLCVPQGRAAILAHLGRDEL